MRVALGVLLLGVAALVGCAADDSSGSLTGGRRTAASSSASTGPSNSAGSTTGTVTAAQTACSAVKAPTQLADAKDATDLAMVGTAVFYQSGINVNQVMKDGTNKKAIFTSKNLVHSYVDKTAMLIVTQPNTDNPAATLRSFKVTGTDGAFPKFDVNTDPNADPGGAATDTNFNAASVHVFGSTDASYYVTADDNNNGNSQIVEVNKDNPGQQNQLVNSDKVISSAQVLDSVLWYVLDNQRVFKMALATDDQPQGQPVEVFGIGYTQCNLAVNASSVFCSVGSAIEARSLDGSTPKTLIDQKASKTQAPFGVAQYFDNHLIVRNLAPDTSVKNVLRTISTTGAPDEQFAACGRNTITGVQVDATHIAWTEDQTGVFVTTR